jgi:hypothetical protein
MITNISILQYDDDDLGRDIQHALVSLSLPHQASSHIPPNTSWDVRRALS